jgi:hypothetical protein
MGFWPEGATVPEELRTDDLVLRMLAPEHVERDYDAVMETRERLRLWSNSTWPEDDFTLESNLEDLRRHEREHLAREAFAFTVLSRDESRVEGCIYIMPLSMLLEYRDLLDSGAADDPERIACVGFWVRESALPRELDRQLLAGLIPWFQQEWPFEHVALLTNDTQEHDGALLAHLGARRWLMMRSKESEREWFLWKLPDA